MAHNAILEDPFDEYDAHDVQMDYELHREKEEGGERGAGDLIVGGSARCDDSKEGGDRRHVDQFIAEVPPAIGGGGDDSVQDVEGVERATGEGTYGGAI